MAAMTAGVTGSYMGYVAQRAFLGKEGRDRKLKATHTKAARRVTDELSVLRGPAMKLGQALSLQTGIPDEIIQELATLQMQAPGMHPSLVRAQFKASMKAAPEEIFRSFEPEPFAAASLGQVHRAVTTTGDVVAVKIQYPGMRRAIASDFTFFRTLATTTQLSRYIPESIVAELEQQILAETDYRREADNIDFFREHLRPLPFVTVPDVYRQFSSDRVLTMSYLDGDHLDRFLARRPSQRLRDTLGARLMDLFYFQLLRIEAFHADPHWGNYLFGADGTVGLVDFGCVKYLPHEFVENLKTIFLYPGDRQSAEFRQLLAERYAMRGERMKPAGLHALVRFTDGFIRRLYPPEPEKEQTPFDFSDAEFLRDFVRESTKLLRAKAALPEYVLWARAESGLFQTLHRLKARVRTSLIVRKYLEPRSVLFSGA
jgi:predicted unusual protein kinase regulating ubiquinone biosynthesis (AarF/ABC1/UbiB family)